MENHLLEWRDSINLWYPNGLADFKDLRTIEIQLEQCNEWLAWDRSSRELIKIDPEAIKDWNETYANTRTKITALKAELELWITKRRSPA